MYTIREFVKGQEEFAKLYDLLVNNFALEHDLGSLSADNLNVEKVLNWMVRNIETATFVAIEDETGRMIGSIGLHEDSPWWSDEQYLGDGWLYVLPEHRANKVAARLLEAAKDFASKRGLPLMVGVLNATDIEVKFEMMRKRGFAPVGGIFLAEV